MKTSEKSLVHHVQFWSLLGPAALLLTLFVIFIKTPFEGYALPLFAIAGFMASWMLRMKGVLGCLVALAALALHHLYGLGWPFILWYTGISCALALAWVATALGREEIDALLLLNSKRKDTLTKEMENLEKRHQAELHKAAVQIQEGELRRQKLSKELDESKEEVAALQKQGEQVPLALKQLHVEHTQALAAVNRDLDTALRENEALARYRDEAFTAKTAYDKLIQELHQLHSEKEAYQAKTLKSQILIDSLQVSLNEKEAQLGQLASQNSDLEAIKLEVEKLKQECVNLNELLNEKERKIEELSKLEFKAQEPVVWGDSKTREGRALCHLEGLYQQLRIQFEEKANLLDQTRKELFHAQEELLLLQKIKEEESLFSYPQTDKALEKQLRSLEADVTRLEKENAILEELITKLIRT